MTISKGIPKPSKEELLAAALDVLIYEMMLEFGIPANLKGYRYLSDAIRITYYEPQLASRIMEGLYTRIAEENGTTVQCVERSLRTALRRVKRLRDKTVLMKYFDSEVCPSTKKFINSIADRLRRIDIIEYKNSRIPPV
ncbi:MAG: sporulation initiation factor Spo0A C-terminal domain-containing protein [Clostridia bacterium]|nr:sporulation initiation factor Spo0A C-terminal domain-containing protein [Clostridia bacterium]